MKFRHIETFTIDFDEESIAQILVKKALDESYELRYGKFNNSGISFSLNDDGKVFCSIVFDTVKRNDYEEDKNESLQES